MFTLVTRSGDHSVSKFVFSVYTHTRTKKREGLAKSLIIELVKMVGVDRKCSIIVLYNGAVDYCVAPTHI